MSITQESFGTTKNGEKVTLYRITNKNGMIAEVIDYGAIKSTVCTGQGRKA